MSLLRALPPAGEPIRLREIATALGSTRSRAAFPSALRDYLGARHLWLLSSGTAALIVALKALKALRPERTEVILPAYTCPNVLSAVVLAGLHPVLCDVGRDAASLDEAELRGKLGPQSLAVIIVHLFGVGANIAEVAALAREHEAFVVEDAAQAFGNEDGQGRKLGTLADVGIFSFGRGKPLSLGAGGAVVAGSEEVAQAIEAAAVGLKAAGSGCDLLYSLLYATFFRPHLYWLPRSLPWLRLGETIFTLEITLKAMSRFTAALGAAMLPRYGARRRARALRGSALLERLAGAGPLRPLGSLEPNNAYLRLPLLLEDGSRDKLLGRLARLGATGMYPVPLSEQHGAAAYLGEQASSTFPNAKRVAEQVLTLPLHGYLQERDVKKIERALRLPSLQAPVTEAVSRP